MRDANMSKVLTDYPFSDVLVYYTKILGIGCIVKSEQDALNAETTRTKFMGDLYTQSVEGIADYRMYDYTPKVLARAGVPVELIPRIIDEPSNIPKQFRAKAHKLMEKEFIKRYVEENEYYRRILGLPPLGKHPIFVPKHLQDFKLSIDYEVPLHEMTPNAIKIMEKAGIWKKIKDIYNGPDYEYLDFIKADVDIYKARKAEDFQLLYIPSVGVQVLEEKFVRRFNANRAFSMTTVYSDAYKFESKYYDAWMAIFIIIQTMVDIISELQEHVINLDIFDERCIRAIFASHGVPYYNEIPFVYQVRMVKRLHQLLKYKSTAKCMVDICSLFGFDDIRIFRYYLIRDRKIEPDSGEYVFNYKTKTVLDTDQKLVNEKKSLDVFSNGIKIPFPHENFLERGGVMLVNLDGVRVDSSKYEITDGKLVFTDPSILQGKRKMEFLFFSNNTFNDDISLLDDHKIITEVKSYPITNKSQREFTIEIPQENYFENGGYMIASVGATFIDPERYTIEGTNLTFKDKEDWLDAGERSLNIVYVYSNRVKIKSTIKKYTYTNDIYASGFNIPLPDGNYIKNGGEFFTTIGSTHFSKERYFVNGNTFNFISSDDRLTKDRDVSFYFFYTLDKPIEMVESFYEFTVDTIGNQLYDFKEPFPGYNETLYPIEVFFDDIKVDRKEFTILKNSIKINDQTKIMRKGLKVRLRFYYPKDREGTKIIRKHIPIDKETMTFTYVPLYPGLYDGEDKHMVIVDGKIVDKSRYVIDGNNIIFTNPKDKLTSKSKVEVIVIYYETNTHNIHVQEERLKVRQADQKIFNINFPFFNYVKSGNGVIVLVGGTIISPERYTVTSNSIRFDDTVSLDKNREVHCIFIYNSVYDTFNNYIRSEYTFYDLKNGKKFVDIPYPYDNYFESDNNNQMEVMAQDGTVLVEGVDYEIIDDQIAFTDVTNVLTHGDNIIFNFSYVNAKKKEVYIEDPIKNYELKFAKVPLLDSADRYLRDSNAHLDYHRFSDDDWLWTHDFDPAFIEHKILEKEFNYARTKYLSIDTVMSLSELSFQIPYFFSLFFDNLKNEERLRLAVPTIRADKNFRLSSLLCYLFALSFEYYGIEDTIQTETVPIMYVLGFNFEADLNLLRNDLAKNLFTLEKMGIDGFKTYNSNINIKDLLAIFKNNKDIHDKIVKGMYKACNKRIYDAYKKAYDALLIRKYSTKFFRIAGTGRVAKTYTEYLKYNDKDLYNSILEARSIEDIEERKKFIVETIVNVTGYIENYFGSKEYNKLFNAMPGAGIDFIKMYVSKVIDFFKSYKIEIAGLNTVYTLNNKYLNYIKPIDGIHLISKVRPEDFIEMVDGISRIMADYANKDHVTLQDIIYIFRYFMKKFNVNDVGLNVRLKRAFEKFLDKIRYIVTLKATDIDKDTKRNLIRKEVVKILSRIKIYDLTNVESFDTIRHKSKLIPYDGLDLIEHVYISRYDSKPSDKHISNLDT